MRRITIIIALLIVLLIASTPNLAMAQAPTPWFRPPGPGVTDPQAYPYGYSLADHALEFPGFDPANKTYNDAAFLAAIEKWYRYSGTTGLSTGLGLCFQGPPVR